MQGVAGQRNTADQATKSLDGRRTEMLAKAMGYVDLQKGLKGEIGEKFYKFTDEKNTEGKVSMVMAGGPQGDGLTLKTFLGALLALLSMSATTAMTDIMKCKERTEVELITKYGEDGERGNTSIFAVIFGFVVMLLMMVSIHVRCVYYRDAYDKKNKQWLRLKAESEGKESAIQELQRRLHDSQREWSTVLDMLTDANVEIEELTARNEVNVIDYTRHGERFDLNPECQGLRSRRTPLERRTLCAYCQMVAR